MSDDQMNCEQIAEQLDKICAEECGADLITRANDHIAVCPHCTRLVAEHRAYLELMRGFAAPDLAPGRSAQMLRAAAQAGAQRAQKPAANQSHFLRGFIAASLLFFCMTLGWNFYKGSTEQRVAMDLPEYVASDVTLVIYVPGDMPDAGLTISLPDDVLVAGYEDLRKLFWNVDLKEGANTLSLPIKVPAGYDRQQALRFMAKIDYNNKQKEFELKVKLSAPRSEV